MFLDYTLMLNFIFEVIQNQTSKISNLESRLWEFLGLLKL